MATQTIELSAPTGLTLTLTTYPDGSNVPTVRTLTEGVPTKYSVTFTGTMAGLYYCVLGQGAKPIGDGYLQIASTDGTYTVVNDKPTVYADTILQRNLAGGSDGGRTVQDSLRTNRNRVKYDTTTFTVYKEDDVTVAWTGAVVPAAVGDVGIREIDPS